MILINSHFAINKGTTDFFVDFLMHQEKKFYLLKHPFDSSEVKNIELFVCKGREMKIIGKYPKFKLNILNLFNDFVVSIFVSLKLGNKVTTIIGVGSFNIVPFILTNLFFKRKNVFWGVDYSTRRFGNPVLNFIYQTFETIACKYSNYTISQSPRQEEVRIKFHGLKKERSILSSNGIVEIKDFGINKNTEGKEFNLVYIGSITEQHGIVDFVDYFYVKNNSPYKLHIIGSGTETESLKRKILLSQNSERVNYLGYKNQAEIVEYLEKIDGKIFGIAPYSNLYNDHVYYGDSLKLKEYLLYNIPFITSEVTYIPPDLAEFGVIYKDFEDLNGKMLQAEKLNLNINNKNQKLKMHTWDSLLNNIINKINI